MAFTSSLLVLLLPAMAKRMPLPHPADTANPLRHVLELPTPRTPAGFTKPRKDFFLTHADRVVQNLYTAAAVISTW
jgi:hypothetical protein